METWRPTEGAKYGIAIYNFDGKVNHGLQLDIGDAVQIFEGCAGWYRGCCLKNKALKGIFPASFVQLKECIVENLGTPLEIITPNGDAIIKEVTAVLREWLELWKKLFLKNDQTKFLEMKKIMDHLVNLRLKILSGVLTQALIVELKAEMTSKIDFWN
ncbi:dedicator of cytokinesis 3 isoform X1, partial [Paramuricea clavata]